jgi:mono/diheme cytochrome c family protein
MNRSKFTFRNALVAVVSGLLTASSVQTAGADEAKELFLKSCAPCHGKDGKAETPAARKLGVKDLSLSKLTDAQIEQQIREGKQENQTTVKMPAFKDRLSDEEIKSLVPVTREFRNAPAQKSGSAP